MTSRTMPSRWLLAAALTSLGCPSSSPRESLEPSGAVRTPSPSSETLPERRYAGTYAYAGTDAERAAIRTAVETATAGMVGKNIARGELMKRSEVRASYTIRFDEKGNLSVETPGFPPETSPVDGTEVQFKNKYGDVLQNSQQFVDGALVQRSRTSDGGGSTEFRLQPDGNTMVVTRVSKSPKLPHTVEFKLTYLRQRATP
jgi:hypothetical protein